MSDIHPDDQAPDDRFAAEITREIEIIKGERYRFTLVGHQAKPNITEDDPRSRTIVPVISIEATITGVVHDITEGALFVVFEGGSMTITQEAITWVEPEPWPENPPSEPILLDAADEAELHLEIQQRLEAELGPPEDPDADLG